MQRLAAVAFALRICGQNKAKLRNTLSTIDKPAKASRSTGCFFSDNQTEPVPAALVPGGQADIK